LSNGAFFLRSDVFGFAVPVDIVRPSTNHQRSQQHFEKRISGAEANLAIPDSSYNQRADVQPMCP
jgi:hypothetical protein